MSAVDCIEREVVVAIVAATANCIRVATTKQMKNLYFFFQKTDFIVNCLEAYKVEPNYRNDTPQIDQDT